MALGVFLVGLGIGLGTGWLLAARRLDALRREHAQRRSEIRNHVLPLLEHRASATGVPPDRRARDVADPMIASIAIARAIQELDSKRDLPYSDTLEVSTEEIVSAVHAKRPEQKSG
jgi:hypothetical protein